MATLIFIRYQILHQSAKKIISSSIFFVKLYCKCDYNEDSSEPLDFFFISTICKIVPQHMLAFNIALKKHSIKSVKDERASETP